MDRADRALMEALQADSSRSVAELADLVNLSPSACHRRIKALEEQGLILGYAARVDARNLPTIGLRRPKGHRSAPIGARGHRRRTRPPRHGRHCRMKIVMTCNRRSSRLGSSRKPGQACPAGRHGPAAIPVHGVWSFREPRRHGRGFDGDE